MFSEMEWLLTFVHNEDFFIYNKLIKITNQAYFQRPKRHMLMLKSKKFKT